MKSALCKWLFEEDIGLLSSVRKIIAIVMTGVFCYLTITDKVKASEYIPIYSMILGYYFGKSTALDNPAKNIQKPNKRTTKKSNDDTTG